MSGALDLVDSLVTPTAFSLVLAFALGFAWRTWRQPYLLHWTGFWALYALVWPALAAVYAMGGPLAGPGASALHAALTLAAFTARLLAWSGTAAYMGWRLPGPRGRWLLAALVMALVAGGLAMRFAVAAGRMPALAQLPFRTYTLGGLLFLGSGIQVLRGAAGPAGRSCRLLGVALLASAASDLWDVGLELVARPAWSGGAAALRLSAIGTTICDTLFATGMLVAAIGTERDRAEAAAAALRRRDADDQQAQRLDAIGRLAAGVAHDFNNVLTAIGASLAFLKPRLPPADEGQQDLEVARGATARAAELVRQLLTFAQRQVVRPERVDLAGRITALEPLLASAAGEDRVRRVALPPGLWPVVVDPLELERLLVALVLHARDATPPGGSISIAAANVSLGQEPRPPEAAGVPAGDWVRLTVEDDGRGMDEVARARVFEPFYSTLALGSGTGLGLATVHGVATQAGGHVGVASAPGAGSRFAVHLPRAGAAALAPAPPAEATAGLGTALLVEDDPSVRLVAARALRERGFDVVPATDGRDALRLLEGLGAPALVVTDVVMPLLGGLALVEQVARAHPGVPVLFISGHAAGAVGASLPPGTPVDFLAKPFGPEVLGDRAVALVERAAVQRAGRAGRSAEARAGRTA